MTTIWIITQGDDGQFSDFTRGYFSTKKKAETFIAGQTAPTDPRNTYEITEATLDAQVAE